MAEDSPEVDLEAAEAAAGDRLLIVILFHYSGLHGCSPLFYAKKQLKYYKGVLL